MINSNKRFIFGLLLLSAVASPALAESRIELDETKVQGANELPKVLYIVPWKKTEMDTKPVKLNTMVDEVMSPVDKDVLQRQVQFYKENKLGQ
jgi:hypothetical protein